MCGFLYTSFEISDEQIVASETTVKNRGPDKRVVFRNGGHVYVHYLLHITGELTPQPIYNPSKESFLLYNGEVYNYKEFSNSASDGYCILDAYSADGVDGFKKLDGEFSGIIHDIKSSKIIIFRDVFGTKPLYLARDERGWAVASYMSQLNSLGFKKIWRSPCNSILSINLESGDHENTQYRTFDLKQHKNSYDHWTEAFYKSIKKRTNNTDIKYFIGLSGGYDSGLISAVLNDLDVKFNSYSVKADEDLNVMTSRINLIKHGKLIHLTKEEYENEREFLLKNCEPFYSKPRPTRTSGYSVLNDKGAVGTGIICRIAQSHGCRVYISGQGADEIISDYGFAGRPAPAFLHSTLGGHFPEDLSQVFPWENFYHGTQEEFLAKDEHVGGTYGLEVRYPFLDFDLVQEFLWLSADLKNQRYKAPIDNALKKLSWPMSSGGVYSKVGFRANQKFKV